MLVVAVAAAAAEGARGVAEWVVADRGGGPCGLKSMGNMSSSAERLYLFMKAESSVASSSSSKRKRSLNVGTILSR